MISATDRPASSWPASSARSAPNGGGLVLRGIRRGDDLRGDQAAALELASQLPPGRHVAIPIKDRLAHRAAAAGAASITPAHRPPCPPGLEAIGPGVAVAAGPSLVGAPVRGTHPIVAARCNARNSLIAEAGRIRLLTELRSFRSGEKGTSSTVRLVLRVSGAPHRRLAAAGLKPKPGVTSRSWRVPRSPLFGPRTMPSVFAERPRRSTSLAWPRCRLECGRYDRYGTRRAAVKASGAGLAARPTGDIRRAPSGVTIPGAYAAQARPRRDRGTRSRWLALAQRPKADRAATG